MAETITAAASPALDHIIERPRLIARFNEGGGARVSLLAAPAGYGKTTLARQWSQRQTEPVAWYRTTHASGDVALLAVQLDELLASIAAELPREPEKVASIASVNPSPQPLGRAILRTFRTLGRDGRGRGAPLDARRGARHPVPDHDESATGLVYAAARGVRGGSRDRSGRARHDRRGGDQGPCRRSSCFRPSTPDAHCRRLARRPGPRGDERRR